MIVRSLITAVGDRELPMRRTILLLPVLMTGPAACGAASGVGTGGGEHTVVYRVEGTAKTGDVSYTTSTGTSKEDNVKLPWTVEFKAEGSTSLSVNGQSKDAGGVACSITVDGKEVSARKSDQELPVASCDSFIAS